MTSTHQVLYEMRDHLSAREEEYGGGTSADEGEQSQFMPSKKLFKGSFEDMRSAKEMHHNQLEIQE